MLLAIGLLVPAAAHAWWGGDNIERLQECTMPREFNAAELATVLEANRVYVVPRTAPKGDADASRGWLKRHHLDGDLATYPGRSKGVPLDAATRLQVTGTVFLMKPTRLERIVGNHGVFAFFELAVGAVGDARYALNAQLMPGEQWPLCEDAAAAERGGRNWSKHPPAPPVEE